MIDLSFISIPLVCLLVIYAVMWPSYTLVAALFPTPKVKRGDSSPLVSIVVPANNEINDVFWSEYNTFSVFFIFFKEFLVDMANQ